MATAVLCIWPAGEGSGPAAQRGFALTKHHRQETHRGRPDEQCSSEPGPCRHITPESDAIVWPRLRLAMPSSRPGRRQRWRTLLVLMIATTIWALRWLWPLQMLPGWVLALMFAWAGIELIVLIWRPHRWRLGRSCTCPRT